MKTQYYTATSLDGFIATEDHSLDWLMQFGDSEESSYPEFIAEVGAIVMGARTYEWVLQHAIYPESGEASPWPYAQPCWVMTSKPLREIPGADIRFASGDVRKVHAEMVAAANGKNIWLVGGGELVGQFYDNGLLDEIIVQVTPVTLGSGQPLLPRRIAFPPMKLTDVKRFGVFVELRYSVTPPNREE
ncbi:MAG: dihydrofolate reductase [Planctomycetaceae bacterium]|nr:dihydrofolate reductase [Planctomycetaceae bacterium]